MKKGCFVLLMLVFAKTILSQSSISGINIVVSPLLISKTSLKNHSTVPPPNKLELPYGFGFYLGFMIRNTFKNEKSELEIGCLLKQKSYKVSLTVESNYQNTPTITYLGNSDNYKKTRGANSFCIPIKYSYLLKNKNLQFSPNLGCSLDILFRKKDPYDPFSFAGGSDSTFRYNIFDYTPRQFNISLQAGFSVGKVLKNTNIIKVGLSFNYGLMNEREGELRIVIKNTEYKNYLTYKGHYLAIELIYSFSRKETK